MQALDIIRRLSETATLILAFWQGAPILARRSLTAHSLPRAVAPNLAVGESPETGREFGGGQEKVRSGRTPGSSFALLRSLWK
jgi:hypothetical protein